MGTIEGLKEEGNTKLKAGEFGAAVGLLVGFGVGHGGDPARLTHGVGFGVGGDVGCGVGCAVGEPVATLWRFAQSWPAMSLSSSRVRSESCRCFPRAACAGVFCVVARIAEDIVCDAILGRSFRCQTVPTTRAARMVTFAWFRASDNRHNTK